MKHLLHFFIICLMLIITSGCDMEQIIPRTGITDDIFNLDAKKGAKDKGNPLSGKNCKLVRLLP